MRPLEILLSVVNLLAFCRLFIPRFRALRWAVYLALVAALVAALQIIVEGPRWQMLPAYGLAAALLLVGWAGTAIPGGARVTRLLAAVGAVLGGLVLAVSIALPALLPVFHFPKPTGPYAIGTLTYHWVDTNRPEIFTPDPNDRRELMVQVWYPAKADPSARRAAYIQDAKALAPHLARLFHFPPFFFTHFQYVTTNAVASAPASGEQARYPVLIYLAGLDGFRSSSTFQIEALVSHGYIVVGIDQPGGAALVRFPDGRQIPGLSKAEIDPFTMQSIEPQPDPPVLNGQALPDGILPYFAQDVSFVLDQLSLINQDDPQGILTGRLDLERAGVFGISLGGENAAEACLRDARLKACLIMDVWIPEDVVRSSLKQPVMFITRDADTMRLERERSGGWTEKDIALTIDTMQALFASLPGDGYYLQIPKIFHLNFTDAPYWSPVLSQFGLTGPIDRQRGFDILNAYSLAFFDRYLLGRPSPLLEGPAAQYPEVQIEIHP